MTLEDECRLSFYKEVADINKEHHVVLVKNIETKKFFVKKTMKLYSRDVFYYLYKNPISGLPCIIDIFENDNDLIVIEEYISGKTLDEFLAEKKTLSQKEAKIIMTGLCNILQKLHQAEPRIIHRDIKPSNIIVTKDGAVRLLDMNAAKFHREGENVDTSLIGTVHYAAPEQYGFSQSDVTTDIYALGVLLNVMLTGDFPNNKVADGEMGEIIKKCTSMDAKKRFRNVHELDLAIAKINENRKTKKDRVILKFAPVGFRTLKWWKILISTLLYISLWKYCWDLPVTTENVGIAYKVLIFLGLIGSIFFLFDYGDIQSLMNIYKIEKIGLRNFLRILIAIAIPSIPIAFVCFLNYSQTLTL